VTFKQAADVSTHATELPAGDELAQSIFDAAVDAILTIDERGVIQAANAAVERLFGYRRDELIGRNVKMLAPAPYREAHDDYLRRYLDTGERKIIGIGREVLGQRKDGSVFPIHLAVSELSWGGRRLFTGIVRDISELKQAQQRALQAERLAAIGQMVTGLAHESRNAIQRAQACLEMLALDLEHSPELLDLVGRSKQALSDLHRLYEEVRSYAAPIRLEPAACDLSEIWRRTWSHLELTRAHKEVQLTEELQGLAPVCVVDRHRIEQVFRNILENAIDACPDPGEVRIACAETDLGGAPALQIALSDNGPGLTPEQERRAFEPFFSTKKMGTGLGMAIAKRLVEAHGGRIEMGNNGRSGTVVRVTFLRELPTDH
jgi:PAS domain S-box-containing protein